MKLDWDTYFMTLAKVSALRSKDPNTKVGTCIVNQDKRVIGLGYNGMPNGNDKDFPWENQAINEKDKKYAYVVHAEINAILNSTVSTKNSTIYTSLYPCSNCAKIIAQAGPKEVIYEDDKYHDTDDAKIARFIFEKTNIKTKKIDKIVNIFVSLKENA